MRYRVGGAALVLLFLPLTLNAQRGSGWHGVSGGTSTLPPGGSLSGPNSADLRLVLSGKVVVDDGSALPEEAAIQMTCKGRRQNLGYTDSKGVFSIQLTLRPQPATSAPEAADSDPSAYGSAGPQVASTNWQDCDVQADLPGFTSPVVDLGSKIGSDLRVDLGNLSLHRIARVEGYTISATSAAAPAKARKAYEKGLALERNHKWAEAQGKFQAAVDAYARYADAWLELGRVQLQQGNEVGAHHSFQQAVAADPKFTKPYQELAQLAVKQHQWQDLADTVGHLLRLNSANYPQYWFLSAVAYYNLRDFDVARQNALRGLTLDVQHRVPELEHILALALIQQHDYKAAEEHIRNYLRLAPKGPNTELAEQQLSELERVQAEATADDDLDDTTADDH